jgi:hypothetical protein
LTDWASMMAAEGCAFLLRCWRTLSEIAKVF